MIRTRVNMSGLVNGGGVSTMYWGEDTAEAAAAAATGLNAFWQSIADRISAAVTLSMDSEVEVVDASTGLITGTHSVTGWSVVGTDTGATLPPITQGLIRWRTGVFGPATATAPGGREIRGKTFIPGPTIASVDGGKPNAAYRTDLANAAATLRDISTPVSLVVYSPTYRLGPNVNNSSVWTEFASLRGRRD